ncbi:MAG: hypothetical protein KF723_22340 [Rhizobiaceae bacterium]|nr:hypothetical protein [Rhizobiaceae bacterium]
MAKSPLTAEKPAPAAFEIQAGIAKSLGVARALLIGRRATAFKGVAQGKGGTIDRVDIGHEGQIIVRVPVPAAPTVEEYLYFTLEEAEIGGREP